MSDQHDGSIAEAVQAASAPSNGIADLLRQGYEKAKAGAGPKDLVLPGYGEPESELHVTFRQLTDYEEAREAITAKLKKQGLSDAAREQELGLATLTLAAESSYAVVSGERHEIGLPLGLALYNYLFPNQPGPQNDEQATVLLFHGNTLRMMDFYARVDRWIRRGGVDAEDDLLGE